MLQGETQDCEVSLALPCPKTCKNLWRSCVDHHSFFSSSRSCRSPKYNNSPVQTYRRLITQHLGLGNSKPQRWAFAGHVQNNHLCILNMNVGFLLRFLPNLQWSGVPAGGGRDGLEPSAAAVTFVRAFRNQEFALEVAPNYPQLVNPAGWTPTLMTHFSSQRLTSLFELSFFPLIQF